MSNKLEKFPDDFFVIAGPCVIEDDEKLSGKDFLLPIAEKLKEISEKHQVPIIFKASFDKANRSSINSYRGPGLKRGLEILFSIKKITGLPVLSDVHTPDMVEPCQKVLDVLQIPAFLARQTDFYRLAGKFKTLINVKKGQFMAPQEMTNVIEKYRQSGGDHISITERGTFFGYGNLVVDFRSVQLIREMGVPYIYDATHSLQLPAADPSTGGSTSGGNIQFLEGLIKAQVAAGANGVFIETHPTPGKAWSDATTQYPLEKMDSLVGELKKLYQFSKNLEI